MCHSSEMMMQNQASKVNQVTLAFNGEEEVKVNKNSVNGCHFLQCLLNGPFKESKLIKIDIYVNFFRFEVFEGIINYANDRNFDNAIEDTTFYIEMIQLAYLWLFDELVELLEWLLIDRVCLETVMNLHTLANIFNFDRLKVKCLYYEDMVDEKLLITGPWGRCPRNGHQTHSYEVCKIKGYDRSDDEWDLFTRTRDLDEVDPINKWEGEWYIDN